MSILRRLSLILKGYVSSAGDRLDRIAAEEELREAKSRQKATDELKKAIDQVGNPNPSAAYSPPPRQAVPSKLASDYRLLGLNTDATLDEVEAAWRGLALRADPKRFAAGSDEEKRAAEILRSLNEAYARIRESLNPTEGRFGQLEL